MARKTGKASSNRYKKGGKGAMALAAFLVAIMLVLVGAYYFFAWHSEPVGPAVKPQPLTTTPQKNSSAKSPTPMPVSSSSRKTAGDSQKADAIPWEKYTDDTKREVTGSSQAAIQPRRAELAIIIDDMGSSMKEARELASIGVPLTFAIIPGLRNVREVAAFAAENRIEVMLHMPMQSREYPARRLEENGLLLFQSDEEIKKRVQEYMSQIQIGRASCRERV